ncbi:hypothetical protein [Gelidibacter japonicus]|uniref:hypothetical protein n=1 Tax=Gelidibacter japonicus TaxID=1962232 RepID=UPI003A940074
MKTLRKILVLGLVTAVFFSCKSDDDASSNSTASLQGSWDLVNFSGTVSGFNIDYNIGDVIWTFNTSTLQLTVENNIVSTGPEDIYARYDSGIYSYQVVEIAGEDTLFIDGEDNGVIIFQNASFQLTEAQSPADASFTTFDRR